MGPHATLGTIPDSTATSGPKSCESVEIRERAASREPPRLRGLNKKKSPSGGR